MFDKNNPNRRRNFWIAGAIVLVIFFVCLGLNAIRNSQSQPAPATVAPAEVPTEAPTEEPLVDVFTPAKGADTLLCPHPDSEVAFSDIPGPLTLRGQNELGSYAYVEDNNGNLGWIPVGAIWLSQDVRPLVTDDLSGLTLVSEECPKSEDLSSGLPYWSAEKTSVQSGAEVKLELFVPNGIVCSRGNKNLPNGYTEMVLVTVSENYGSGTCKRSSDGEEVSTTAVYITVVEVEASEEVEKIDFNVPTNAGRLWTEDKGVLGFFADCNLAKPCDIFYPAQSTIILALGGGTINDGVYTKTVTTDGTIGNIYANVCELSEGNCKLTVSDFSAGNVRYTIVFAPFEVPIETLANALNRMSIAPNCGGSGCLTINAYSKNGEEATFKRGDKIEAANVSNLLASPSAPYVEINLIYGSQPTGAEPIILNKVEVGSIYYLAETNSFVNVPEGGGTVFYCGANAEIDGKTCKAGTALRFDGNKSDGSTPGDLNRTVNILSAEPNMIRVYMIYATDFNIYVEDLQSDYPDWEWK